MMRSTASWRLAAIAACSALVAPTAAVAHDFWINPSTFRPSADAAFDVQLLIGHAEEAEPFARNPKRIERFVIFGPGAGGQERDIPGEPGAHPAGIAMVSGPGAYVIGYRSNHARSELPADKFESYLREEGLERIIEERSARGQAGTPGTELYSRCAKSLVRVHGEAASPTLDDGAAAKPLGFTAELVPVGDPSLAKEGDTIKLRLLFKGEPYAGAKVEFAPMHEHDHDVAHSHEHASARSDENGMIWFTADHAGPWLVHCVVMEQAPVGSGADWESWWASLTFEIAGR